MLGDGEWRAHKPKTSNKRRRWHKLHLGIDGGGFIVASELTDSSVDDASVGISMIEKVFRRENAGLSELINRDLSEYWPYLE